MLGRLRWGIVGCGDVVERKSGPAIQLAGRSEIVAVMRRDAEKARAFAQRFAVPKWTTDAAEVIGDPDVDIVYVATPPSSHEEYVRGAARAGKPVLVEKPMSTGAGSARRMIEACERAGVPLFVAYYRRFLPHVQKMRELIRSGHIGRPVLGVIDLATPAPRPVRSTWRDDPTIGGGGNFVDVGSHRLDVMVFLVGEVEEVHGIRTVFDRDSRVEQLVSVCVRFKDGAQATATGDYYSGRRADRFEIVGTGGRIAAENLDSQKFIAQTPGGREEFSFDPFPAPHLGLIRHIESALLDGARNESSGRDGLMTEIILDASARRH